jgi:dTDP-4-amino-4,6-dideoxy-D-galactose acyltransferase
VTELCRFLEWDTAFFGRRIARVEPTTLTQREMHEVLQWCESAAIQGLYWQVSPNAPSSIRLAEDNHFRFVDIRLSFERTLSDVLSQHSHLNIRESRPEDIPQLKQIATGSYTDSRFYFDPHFTREQSDALYQTWVEKSCQGYADAVLVALSSEQVQGFITCSLQADEGIIGLVGVSSSARGQGVGKTIIEAALRWFADRGCHRVSVITQGRNIAAQRLYQRSGFVTRSLELWYHRWSEDTNNETV